MFKIQYFLEEAKKSKTNIYFVCDAAQVSDTISNYLKFLRSSNNKVEVLSIFSGTQWGNAPLDSSPLLFDFMCCNGEYEYEVIEGLMNSSETIHVIYTKKTAIEFLNKMKEFLNIEIEDEGCFLFRWFDPRILRLTDKLFTKKQKEKFYEDIFGWNVFIRGQDIDFKINRLIM